MEMYGIHLFATPMMTESSYTDILFDSYLINNCLTPSELICAKHDLSGFRKLTM